MSLVVACDLRSAFGAIRDQGSRPTCLAFAVSDVHAVARLAIAPLSVEHLYYHAVRRTPGGNPGDGVSLAKILEALRLDGQAAENGWPYLDPLPIDLRQWRPPPTATPVFKRASITAGTAVEVITSQLNTGVPVVLIFMASIAFCSPTDGMVQRRISDNDIGWHAVIGVGHAQGGNKRLLLIRNSWGETWGIGGYAWVEADYIAPRLSGLAIMAAAGSVR